MKIFDFCVVDVLEARWERRKTSDSGRTARTAAAKRDRPAEVQKSARQPTETVGTRKRLITAATRYPEPYPERQ